MNISIPYHEIQDIIKKKQNIGLDISHIEHNVLGVDVQITQILADFIMALYRVRTKHRKCCNGVNIEPGMEVQVVTPLNNTVQVNNWQYVEDAFLRVFGISLRKANCLNVNDLKITKYN